MRQGLFGDFSRLLCRTGIPGHDGRRVLAEIPIGKDPRDACFLCGAQTFDIKVGTERNNRRLGPFINRPLRFPPNLVRN